MTPPLGDILRVLDAFLLAGEVPHMAAEACVNALRNSPFERNVAWAGLTGSALPTATSLKELVALRVSLANGAAHRVECAAMIVVLCHLRRAATSFLRTGDNDRCERDIRELLEAGPHPSLHTACFALREALANVTKEQVYPISAAGVASSLVKKLDMLYYGTLM